MGRLLAVLALTAVRLPALGAAEDPDERLTRTYHLDAMRTLEVRGQIDFELVPAEGKRVEITVETTRALFDQINVSNWWGWGTVAIESGLIGPRERGTVKVRIALPSLDLLTVVDHSHGTGIWPGRQGRLVVTDFSTAELAFSGTSLRVEAAWLSAVTLTGTADVLDAEVRYSSRLDDRGLAAARRTVAADKTSNASKD